MKKHRLLFLRATALMALAVVLLLDAAFLLTKDRAASPLENRTLQTFPALTARDLASGRFETRFDTYLADQFPLRSAWIGVKTALDRLMGRVESNGVFLAKGGRLIQRFTAPGEEDYRRTLDALTAFLDRHGDLRQYVMIAPTAVTVYRDRLPALSDAGDESACLDRLKADLAATPAAFIDLRQPFAAERDGASLYFFTDHHWTCDGARLAYLELSKAAGLTGSTDRFERRLLSSAFQGTLSAASGFRLGATEDLYAFLPTDEAPALVATWVNENRRGASLFDPAPLDGRDKYAVYLGGNHALVKVETPSAPEGVLLVLKDSYANSLIPFLTQDYRKLVVVDPRYFTGDLEVLMQAEGVTDLLILYNADTLAADAALRGDLG